MIQFWAKSLESTLPFRIFNFLTCFYFCEHQVCGIMKWLKTMITVWIPFVYVERIEAGYCSVAYRMLFPFTLDDFVGSIQGSCYHSARCSVSLHCVGVKGMRLSKALFVMIRIFFYNSMSQSFRIMTHAISFFHRICHTGRRQWVQITSANRLVPGRFFF